LTERLITGESQWKQEEIIQEIEKDEVIDPFDHRCHPMELRSATFVSVMLPCIPPMVARPSMATCCMYKEFFQKTHKYFLCWGIIGEFLYALATLREAAWVLGRQEET